MQSRGDLPEQSLQALEIARRIRPAIARVCQFRARRTAVPL